ncbi:MAG: F0F1 ATP synthase subunit B [Atopobiaceae bacterium]|nr:F0F1 ATP synthase subunit B [Atopobiaceae bacterium]
MTQIQSRALHSVAAAALLAMGTPVVALAQEEENTGMKLLMPNMAEFIPACIAFIIMWFILAKFAWPMVLKMMDDRENKIKGDLDAAAKAHAEAEDARQAYEGMLEEADRRADEIIAQAKHDAEVLRADATSKAQEESQAIIAKAHDVIDAEREKAMAELAGSVVDLAVEIAGKIIGDALDVDEQRALANKYLAEVGSLNDD